MYLAINILGLLVFLGIGFLFSKDKSDQLESNCYHDCIEPGPGLVPDWFSCWSCRR